MMSRGEGEGVPAREVRDGGVAPGGRRAHGPVARLHLARRVVALLEPLDGARLDADVENPALPPSAVATPLLRTDLLLTALDLRIRLALLPGVSAAELESAEVFTAAMTMLAEHPDTASVVVITDAEGLTCRIIEPFDRMDVVSSGAQESPDSIQRRGPVDVVVREYLRQVNPPWQAPDAIVSRPAEMESVALAAARRSLENIQSQRKNKVEWREARLALSDADAVWISELALNVLLGEETIEVEQQVDGRSSRSAP